MKTTPVMDTSPELRTRLMTRLSFLFALRDRHTAF
jgi:hypothetical protein